MEISVPLAALLWTIAKDCARLVTQHVFIDEKITSESLTQHILEIDRWSERIQFIGMGTAKDTDICSRALRISTRPRRFFRDSKERILSESELLKDRSHIVLLGDPGAGKTTTAKRIIRSTIHNEPSESDAHIEFPLLVVARELARGEGILLRVAKILAAKHNIHASRDKDEADPQKLIEFVLSFLAEAPVLVIVDGIDEVDSDIRITVERDLAKMAKVVSKGQILVTCRSGDYPRLIEGFDVAELQPLSPEEIRDIVALWCDDPDSFVAQVAAKPYSDLLNRPLYLCQIVLVFNEWRRLPERPVEIYRRVSLLMIEKWDRERQIVRASKYSTFSPEDKLDFLSHMAHDLLMFRLRQSFTDDDLRAVYSGICEHVNLPRDQEATVAEEIESHTGFIVMSSAARYEFSHLSLQEYLAANYLLRQPSMSKVAEFLQIYAASPAIAVCLSSDSSEYFSQLFFACRDAAILKDGGHQILSFLQRLKVENPRFAKSARLGAAVLLLVARYGGEQGSATLRSWPNALADLFSHEPIVESVKAALHFYVAERRDSFTVLVLRAAVTAQAADFEHEIRLSEQSARLIGMA